MPRKTKRTQVKRRNPLVAVTRRRGIKVVPSIKAYKRRLKHPKVPGGEDTA